MQCKYWAFFLVLIIAGSVQYCRNFQLDLFEKSEFKCSRGAVKSDFAHMCTDFCHSIKDEKTLMFQDPVI